MAISRSSVGELCGELRARCLAAYGETTASAAHCGAIDELAERVDLLYQFVYEYTLIEDTSLNTDDEILNWAFSDAPLDLCSAIWLLSSGFYKNSASCLRNAFDIALASLYFQIRQNTNPVQKGYNKFFAEWDAGSRQTPNWGEMTTFIKNQPAVKRFCSNQPIDPIAEAYSHFRHLCSFTHTSAYTPKGEPVTAINSTGIAPTFDEHFFDRGCKLVEETISHIAILWQVAFPQIKAVKSVEEFASAGYARLFLGALGAAALKHR
jgi:hypothetical protein